MTLSSKQIFSILGLLVLGLAGMFLAKDPAVAGPMVIVVALVAAGAVIYGGSGGGGGSVNLEGL
jgi:hypothetical protein